MRKHAFRTRKVLIETPAVSRLVAIVLLMLEFWLLELLLLLKWLLRLLLL
jgi:hypothetical protein